MCAEQSWESRVGRTLAKMPLSISSISEFLKNSMLSVLVNCSQTSFSQTSCPTYLLYKHRVIFNDSHIQPFQRGRHCIVFWFLFLHAGVHCFHFLCSFSYAMEQMKEESYFSSSDGSVSKKGLHSYLFLIRKVKQEDSSNKSVSQEYRANSIKYNYTENLLWFRILLWCFLSLSPCIL